jgi:hypothetical protein
MERIANPVTGRTDTSWATVPEAEVPLHRLLSRYAWALMVPVMMLVGPATADAPPWLVLLATIAVILVLSVAAHGSWWRPAPFGPWQLAPLVEGGVAAVAIAASIIANEQRIVTLAAVLLIGAVLGVGVSQLWRWRAARR